MSESDVKEEQQVEIDEEQNVNNLSNHQEKDASKDIDMKEEQKVVEVDDQGNPVIFQDEDGKPEEDQNKDLENPESNQDGKIDGSDSKLISQENDKIDQKSNGDIDHKLNENEVNEENQIKQTDSEKAIEDDKAYQKEIEKQIEEEEESDEEYSGEGCFIGYRNTDALRDLIVTPMQRFAEWNEKLRHYKFITPKVRAKPTILTISKVSSTNDRKVEYQDVVYKKALSHRSILDSLKFTNSLYFPHRNLVQYDCGKLHKMSILLKTLKAKGSKVLIFTQMTKMLNLLEQFLNLHGYTYIRLDGSVKVEMRQKLVDMFNLNKKIFCFISSTRCGGIGINLTGAD